MFCKIESGIMIPVIRIDPSFKQLQTASEVKSDLSFEISEPNYSTYPCADC